jgi:hypothetical protein
MTMQDMKEEFNKYSEILRNQIKILEMKILVTQLKTQLKC